MNEKERMEALFKLAKDLNDTIARIGKEKGQDDGIPKSDAIQKDQLEKMKTDILVAIDAKNPPKKKFVFGGKEDLKENQQRVGFGEYLLMVKAKHPEIAEQFIKTVMSEGTPAQGGYTVPIEYSNEIIGELNDSPTIIPKCTRFPQSTNTKNIPKWLTDLIITWVTEAGIKQQTKPTLEQKQSILGKMAAIVTFTDEYLQDDITGIAPRVTKLVGENMGVEVERVALVGDVAGLGDPFNGILYSVGINTVPQVGASLAYSDIVHIWNNTNVLTKYTAGKPEWYINKTVLGYIMNMLDANSRPIWNLATPIGDKMVGTILGDPYNLSSQIGSTYSIVGAGADESVIIYGDYKFVVLGEKKGMGGISVDVSNSAVISTAEGVVSENLWTQDETGYRFVLRKSVVVAIPQAYSVGTGIK